MENEGSNLIPAGVHKLIEEFGDLFNDDHSGSNIQISLKLNDNASPKFCGVCQVPFALAPRINDEINSLIRENVITLARYTEWATPIVPVINPDKSTSMWRFQSNS